MMLSPSAASVSAAVAMPVAEGASDRFNGTSDRLSGVFDRRLNMSLLSGGANDQT